MNIPKSDLKIERVSGSGPGGQHRNRTASAVRLTHLPTGIQAYADERSQHHSYRKAMKVLVERLEAEVNQKAADAKKADRDRKVRESVRVRTYNQFRGEVIDHRTGIKRRFDDVVRRGDLDDLLDIG